MKKEKKKAPMILITELEVDFQWYLNKHPQLTIQMYSK